MLMLHMQCIVTYSNNHHSGTIPESLFTLTALTQLFLEDIRHLSGSLSSHIGRLTAIELFTVAGGQLSGTLPSALWRLTTLTFIGVFENSISGKLRI